MKEKTAIPSALNAL